MCAACMRAKRGQTTLDGHHVAGKSNSPVAIHVPVNDHRAVLNGAQYDWPKETLENPDNSPLLADAARIRGYLDTDRYLKEELLLQVAERNEMVNAFLVEKFGRKWSTCRDFRQFVWRYRQSKCRPTLPVR